MVERPFEQRGAQDYGREEDEGLHQRCGRRRRVRVRLRIIRRGGVTQAVAHAVIAEAVVV